MKTIFPLLMCLIPSLLVAQDQQRKVDERLSHLTKSQLKQHYLYLQPHSEYRNEKLEAYVKKVGERILAQSGHAGQKYAFIIRDNPMPGASVTGSPVVYIDRGLFAALNSEAEFAGVLGHELGHNVARHVAKSKRKQISTNVLATLASIMVGNSGVGSAIRSQRQVNFFEYRREAELEADRLGAEYMYKANYEPSALIMGLSQVFDVSKYIAGVGVDEITHHGLRASHPREDRRLLKVIETSGQLTPGEGVIGRDEYRAAVDGVVFGPNYKKNAPDGYKRYVNETLGITFIHPESWSRSIKGSKIVLKDGEKTMQLKISIEKTVNNKLTSEEAIKEKYPDGLVGLQKIHPNSERDLGTIGARPAQRVALSKVARNTFHFLGIAKNGDITPAQDGEFVNIIRSFRRITPKDKLVDGVVEIYYERLKPGETFSSLALKAKDFGDEDIEAALRVINGYHPNGEAEPGTWIKNKKGVPL